MAEPLSAMPDFLASGLCVAYAMLLILGVKISAKVNTVLTLLNLMVMAVFAYLSFFYGDFTNIIAGGILPYGFSGVVTGELFRIE